MQRSKTKARLDKDVKIHYNISRYRGVAKFGIALGSGPRGLGFESRHSDQIRKSTRWVDFLICSVEGIRTFKCDADERRRRLLEADEPVSAPDADANESRHFEYNSLEIQSC